MTTSLTTLPQEILFKIALKCGVKEIVLWKRVCKEFCRIFSEEALWRSIYTRDYPGEDRQFANFQKAYSMSYIITWRTAHEKPPFVTQHERFKNVAGYNPITVSPYDRHIVLLCEAYPSVIKVWDRKTDECKTSEVLPLNNATAIAIMNPVRFIAVEESYDIGVWDLQTVKRLEKLPSNGSLMSSLAKASDHEAISGDYSGKIALWDLKQKTRQVWQDSHGGCIYALIVSDNCLFSGSNDGTVKVWDRRDAKCTQTFREHTQGVNSLTQTDDHTLISASGDHTIKVWDVRKNECLRTLEGHLQGVRALTLFGVEKFLLSGSDDKTLKVWNWSTGECLKTYGPFSEQVRYVVKLDEGEVFLKVEGGPLQVWDFTKSG